MCFCSAPASMLVAGKLLWSVGAAGPGMLQRLAGDKNVHGADPGMGLWDNNCCFVLHVVSHSPIYHFRMFA